MRRLLTGYAVNFNHRHRRSGHLFQNRYKSIVVEEDPYFVELIRYIHLNPLNARVVPSLRELNSYKWSGHRCLIGNNPFPWYDATYVLKWFSDSKKSYRTFIKEGVEKKYLPDLSGGGLIRTLGGLPEALLAKQAPVLTDQRILGSGEFVRNVAQKRPSSLSRFEEMERIISSLCLEEAITREQLTGGSRAGKLPRLRSDLAFILSRQLGISHAAIGRTLGITTSAVSRIMERRESKSR